MRDHEFKTFLAKFDTLKSIRPLGQVMSAEASALRVSGLSTSAHLGDQVRVMCRSGGDLLGEVIAIEPENIRVVCYEELDGVARHDHVVLLDAPSLAPDDTWIGRVIDPFGQPMDGQPLLKGSNRLNLRAAPPSPARRGGLGPRLETGMAAFNTLLPVAKGQRLGLFAGSGIGKSSLIASFARNLEADVVVVALIGERGREVRDFVETTLGLEGMARSVVIAATSDQTALARRRCAWSAMTTAEYFRDTGRNVLLLADSMTRFAEAHREVATAGGELPALRGFPPSTAHLLMQLCERAGPGEPGQGAITAIFSVLVAGSDMDEPISDILRGVLDGHVVLDRTIAERGRFPAVDLLRSVSRSLPGVATADEVAVITEVRQLLGAYDRSATMVHAGLYADGSDPVLDRAIKAWPALDAFLSEPEKQNVANSFNRLKLILRRASKATPSPQTVPSRGSHASGSGTRSTGASPASRGAIVSGTLPG